MQLLPELNAFLEANPDVNQFDVILVDLNGILRGKRLDRNAITKLYKSGILMPRSTFASDIEGDTTDGTGLGIRTGDIDCPCLPVANSLKIVPWAHEPSAQVLAYMVDEDGEALRYTSHGVLQNVIDKFKELKLKPIIAPELEFFLLDRQRDEDGRPLPPISPVTGARDKNTQVYGIAELDDYAAFLRDVKAAAVAQNIPADTAIAEYAPGQFEINLHHSDDLIQACNHAIELKRLIKAVALQHDFDATFMPKPFADLSGNGFHMHISLYDEAGNNVFANGEDLGNDTLRHAIGGLSATMEEGMLLAAPGANSYRRFSPECYTPLHPSWGFNNRTVAMRIPAGPDAAKRVECRVAGADANPYIYLASLLSGIYLGITQQLEPGPVTQVNAYKEFEPTLPLTWDAAIQSFEEAKLLPQVLGSEFCHVFLQIKLAERQKFHEFITMQEYDWYLRHA
ncbi:glutamine synthetase family protein [Umboniibacter marinipuniceus]|uniref:Glutamate--putrescine ligase n=1 Tax=Umboniibacter marinipuniceus TaxID=569599 RepID=A0A3M0A898_9GAMM|nr:glutamine synthetase family protein [Umboniibacter marinipuniceus]RMA81040.1 glutamate--putrescine ligase [Umboniibacter marinipuniceus]